MQQLWQTNVHKGSLNRCYIDRDESSEQVAQKTADALTCDRVKIFLNLEETRRQRGQGKLGNFWGSGGIFRLRQGANMFLERTSKVTQMLKWSFFTFIAADGIQ